MLENQEISKVLVLLHQKYPTLGLDPLYHMVKSIFNCGRQRVWRIKKTLGIVSIRKRKYKATTNAAHAYPIAPNLVRRQFRPSAPNKIWVTDITYVPTDEGWLYVVCFKDLFTKKVVGYAFSDRMTTTLVNEALLMAARRYQPPKGLIIHSDRGVQYASHKFKSLLNLYGFQQSMSRKGNPYDNAVAESFFSCLKCESVHLQRFHTRRQAMTEIFRYIETFYNTVRPHSAIGWLAPQVFEENFYSAS